MALAALRRLRARFTREAATASPGGGQVDGDPGSRRSAGGAVRWSWLLAAVLSLLAYQLWSAWMRHLSEPVELDFGPTSAAFVETLGPLLGAQFTSDNRLRLLSNGHEFFPAMLDDIRHARKSITLEVYIWASGEISDQFIEVLSERARAGVKVHALVDGVGMMNFADADQRRLIDAGVEFVAYGREHWYEVKPDVNHRTHRKLLVVDGRIGYTGGMCIDDTWMGDADSRERWRDIQIRAEGTVVNQMQSVFAANWLQTTGRLLVGPDYFLPYTTGHGALAQCYKSGPHEGPENARISYLLSIASARRSIRIAHAYFVPDDLAIEMLLAARRRGVAIQVVVPDKNDSRFGRAASRSRWGRLLAAGVEFHRYMPAMYHAKLMIVDDAFLTIGSVNFDDRSFRLSDEVNVNVVDEATARAGIALFESDLAQSRPLGLREFESRPVWVKAADHFCGLFRSQL